MDAKCERNHECLRGSGSRAPRAQGVEPAGGREPLAGSVRCPEGVAARNERTQRQLLERARPGEQKALTGNAAQREEGPDLRFEFDAFGDGVESQGLTEGNDGPRKIRS